jgi:phenylacetate-coenzyme A ligase PaaK-like adenylate-forming protein
LGVLEQQASDDPIAFPKLLGIEGRVHDMLVRPDGRRVVPEFVHRVMREYEQIDRYQLIQHSPDHLELKVRRRAMLTKTETEHLQEEFRKYLGNVRLALTESSDFYTKAGKFQHVVGYPVVGLRPE